MSVVTLLRIAVRSLSKYPAITAIALLSLALGIGANAAIYSILDQMLLRKLPVSSPEQLVNLAAPGPKPGSHACNQQGTCDETFSYAMFRDLEREQRAFAGIAAHRFFGANLAYREQTVNTEGVAVSGSYFAILGIQPLIGRLLTGADDTTIGGHPVAVLSEEYWRTQFNSDPNVVNDVLTLNGRPYTIVGVTPRGFHGTTLGSRPAVFVPITMYGILQPGFVNANRNGFENRRSYFLYLFARLKDRSSIEQAATEINIPYSGILTSVEAPLQQGMTEQTMTQFKARRILLSRGDRGQSSLDEERSVPLYLLMAVATVVLLIACANIANLLVVRGTDRAGEMALRLSLGASQRQLVSQLLVESIVLSIIGGAAGVLVAAWSLQAIQWQLPIETAASLDFTMNRTVVLSAAAIAVTTGILVGVFPAVQSTKPNLITSLRENAGQKGNARGGARFRTALATAQLAMSMALLVAAGLFLKSLINVARVDPGIDVNSLVGFSISPQLNGYTPERSRALFGQIEHDLSALPAVTSVSASMVPLLSGNNYATSITAKGFDPAPDADTNSNYNEVGPGYFRTVGNPLLAGRDFTEADTIGAQPVAIVNEAFVRKFNLGRDAVGKYFRSGIQRSDFLIVGIARDAKYSDVKQNVPPVFFRPYRQNEGIGNLNFYVKTAGLPGSQMRPIRTVLSRLDPKLPVENLKPFEQQVRETVFVDHLIATLSASFALLATLLAAIGLYGVVAYAVSRRTREFGVRMALGANGDAIRRSVLLEVGTIGLLGLAIGFASAFALGRAAQALLFEVDGTDVATFLIAATVMALVAFVAGLVPAERAARTDPMVALRCE